MTRVKLPENVLNGAKRLNNLNGLNCPLRISWCAASLPKPIRLAGGPYHSHEDGWLILGPKYGSIDKLTGPYVLLRRLVEPRDPARILLRRNPPRRFAMALL